MAGQEGKVTRCAQGEAMRIASAALNPPAFVPDTSAMTFPLTAYIEAVLELARYDKLEDDSFAGEIPKLKGVAFGKTLRECENELRSAVADWILVGLRLGHKLPVRVHGKKQNVYSHIVGKR
jgi:predicted RNase H-like HicB family nuclease